MVLNFFSLWFYLLPSAEDRITPIALLVLNRSATELAKKMTLCVEFLFRLHEFVGLEFYAFFIVAVAGHHDQPRYRR